MPGYDCDVIMAAGAFTLGASIELSADAPLREPYAVWLQGALNYHSGQLGGALSCPGDAGRRPAAAVRNQPGAGKAPRLFRAIPREMAGPF